MRAIILSARASSALALGALLALSGCKPPKSEAKTEETKTAASTEAKAPATGPVARVNGVELPREAFTRQMERTRARFERAGRQIAPALEVRLKENLIRKMVDDELISQKAKAEGVALTAEELAAKLSEHKGRFGNDEAFQAFLKRTGQSEEDVKADLERNLLRDKLFEKLLAGKEPTDEDAKKYYEENKDKYRQRDQVRASHILFKAQKSDPPEVKDAKRKQAADVLARAKKPGADFAELAKQYSEGPTAPRGGDLGAFSRGRMVKEFEDAAFAAKPGDILGPIETQFGYHVIKVFEKIPDRQREYDEVKDSILTSLKARAKSQATRDLLRQLKDDAKVEVLEAGINLDRSARAPVPFSPGGKPNLDEKQVARMREIAKQAVGRVQQEKASEPAAEGNADEQ